MSDGFSGNQSPKIYIDTMTNFKSFQTGIFRMSVLKKLSVTQKFMAMQEEMRDCMSQRPNECRARQSMEEFKNQCGCVPWIQGTLQESKVK